MQAAHELDIIVARAVLAGLLIFYNSVSVKEDPA